MKRALLLAAPLALGLLLPGCPLYPDQPYCSSDADCPMGERCDPNSGCYPAGNPLPTYRTCYRPADCAANETCTSANQCRVGTCTTPGYGCVAGYRCGVSAEKSWAGIADVLPAGGASSGGGRGGSVNAGAGGMSAGVGGVPSQAGSAGAGAIGGSPAGVGGTTAGTAGVAGGPNGGVAPIGGSPATGGNPVATAGATGAAGTDSGGAPGEAGSGGFEAGGAAGAGGSDGGAAGSRPMACTATEPVELAPCDQPSYQCTYCGMDLDSACRTCVCQPSAEDAGDTAWVWSCSVF